MRQWQLQGAKARFSEVVRLALEEGAQEITVHGEPQVVILSRREYDRLKKPQSSLLRFLANSPLKGVDLKIKRDRSPARAVDL